MNFDYNTMYREYFKIYEDCKRKYSFGEISESEFRKIVISATNDSLKEDNILVNPKTLDIAFIDLDDLYTRYEEMQYIKEHNLRLKEKCFDRYSEMEMRLTKRNDKGEEIL